MESVEQEIERKGLLAPRVTPERIDAVIRSAKYHVFENTTVTICLLNLENGFQVVGESACASIDNFDPDLGMRIAFDKAKNKIWALEGYLLRQKLHEESTGVTE